MQRWPLVELLLLIPVYKFNWLIIIIIVTIYQLCQFFCRYAGWKNLFDKDMLADPVLKSNFNRALTLMDHAAHGTFIPGMRENMAYFTTSERR